MSSDRLRQFKCYFPDYIKCISMAKYFFIMHTAFHRSFILWWSKNEEIQCRERAKVWNQSDQGNTPISSVILGELFNLAEYLPILFSNKWE